MFFMLLAVINLGLALLNVVEDKPEEVRFWLLMLMLNVILANVTGGC